MEAALPRDRPVRISLAFLQDLLGNLPLGDIAVRLWDGTLWKNSPRPRCTLVLKHPGALRLMFFPANELSLGEAYIHDDFDIEGDLEEALSLADCLFAMHWTLLERLRFLRYRWDLPETGPHLRKQSHSASSFPPPRRRGQKGVRYHYEQPNDFFRLWLGAGMAYSCAYFTNPGDDLETAQERKFDYLCRKLRLQPGDDLLDIGCGWGGLVLHAARHYGVRAHGIAHSPLQVELATERVREAGLTACCRVEVMDYRDLEKPNCYDKVISVGMFESAGAAQLPEYFAQIWRLLRPGGVFLSQGINSTLAQPEPAGQTFLARYLCPGGEWLPLVDALRIAEMTGFEARDLESLREHFTLTLRHWLRRLERAERQATQLSSEMNYRTWRLFLAGAAHAFRMGRLNAYQTLLVKPDHGQAGLPLTRADWYR